MVRSEHVRTLFDSTQSQESKSEVLSISAICSRACHSRSSDVLFFVWERFSLIPVGSGTLNCLESGKTNKCHRRILQTLKYFPFFSLLLDIYVANRDRSSIFKNKKVIAKILFPFIDFLKLSLQLIFSLNFLIPGDRSSWEIYQTNWQFTWRNRNLHPSSLNMTQSVSQWDEQEWIVNTFPAYVSEGI